MTINDGGAPTMGAAKVFLLPNVHCWGCGVPALIGWVLKTNSNRGCRGTSYVCWIKISLLHMNPSKSEQLTRIWANPMCKHNMLCKHKKTKQQHTTTVIGLATLRICVKQYDKSNMGTWNVGNIKQKMSTCWCRHYMWYGFMKSTWNMRKTRNTAFSWKKHCV